MPSATRARRGRRRLIAATVLLMLGWSMAGAVPGRPASAADRPTVYVLELHNVDDQATAYINGQKVMSCPYRNRCARRIDPYLKRGRNLLRIEFANRSSGYAWGYTLTRYGERIAGGECGRVGRESCGPTPKVGVFKVVTRRIEMPPPEAPR